MKLLLPAQAKHRSGKGFCGLEENPGDNRGVFFYPLGTKWLWVPARGGGKADVSGSIFHMGVTIAKPASEPSATAPCPTLDPFKKCCFRVAPELKGVGRAQRSLLGGPEISLWIQRWLHSVVCH